jgi:hypothetical protein
LQSRDQLGNDVAPVSARAIVEEPPRAYSAAIRIIALIAGWLVPGAGHLVLGRIGRAALFFGLLVGSFILGLGLEGRLFWPTVADPPSFMHYDLITVLWSFAQLGAGLCYAGSYLLGYGVVPRPEAPTYEYANTFMILAGLLNYLVMLDAYDIASGRKR